MESQISEIMSDNNPNSYKSCIGKFDAQNTDVYLYSGRIEEFGLGLIYRTVRKKHDNVTLFLNTFGGDGAVGYRIIEYIRNIYSSGILTIVVTHMCKSTGTLMCIGADILHLSPMAELGPIDPQVLNERMTHTKESYATGLYTLDFLNGSALNAFNTFIDGLSNHPSIPKNKVLPVAIELTTGLYSALYLQTDPKQLTELKYVFKSVEAMALNLNEYSRILYPDALNKLLNGFEVHDTPIRLAQATELFKEVYPLEKHEENLDMFIKLKLKNSLYNTGDAIVKNLSIEDLGEISDEES